MAIDAARFAEVTQHIHILWLGMYYYFKNIHTYYLYYFKRSTSTYNRTCFTLSTNAIFNNSWCCIIINYDSN